MRGFLCLFSFLKKHDNNTSEYTSEYTFKIEVVKRRYSNPKLYIPTKTVNGRKSSSIDPGVRWYVYFRYDKKLYKFYKGLNRFKTIKERKYYGNELVKAYTEMLSRGWNPESQKYKEPKSTVLTIEKGLKLALENKRQNLKPSTYKDYHHRLEKFIEYCKEHLILGLPVEQLARKQFAAYLNHLSKTGSNKTSVANHKRVISALFSKLVDDYIIEFNPIKGIKTQAADPDKNTPFTIEQIKTIIEYCKKHDPYMILIIKFIVYGLLRPVEVVRLRRKNLSPDLIIIETKTDRDAHIRVIDDLKPLVRTLIKECEFENDFIITRFNKPGKWINVKGSCKGEETGERSRYDYFSRRFATIKKAVGIGDEYGLYSFRHSAIFSLYRSYVNDGLTDREAILKLMPITRHKTEQALNKYLRQKGAMLPPDYSDRFNFDL